MIPIAAVLERLRTSGVLVEPNPRTGLTVAGISDDSRTIRSGELYCAVRGHVHDGHDFLADAARAGAVAALVETPDAHLTLPQYRVNDSRRAAAVAAQVVYGEPAAELRLVGVTGTNGKTTTVHIARHVLGRRFRCAGLGTLGVVGPDGRREPTALTTPGPIEFARRLRELRDGGADCAVTEVSSHALSQGRVDGARFAAAVFTNLTRDHLDYHADLAAYRDAKARLADLVEPDGTLVVNADEPAWSALPDRGRRVTFGLGEGAEYRATDLRLDSRGSRWKLVAPAGSVEVELPLLGELNVWNALAAAALGVELGVEATAVAEALGAVPAVPGRLEVLAREPLTLRDYAHTPDALRRALSALRPLATGRLIVVFGCGGERDPGKRPLMGRAAAAGADYVIVTSDNPRGEEPEAIIDEIMPGLGDVPHERESDRQAAIARALDMAAPGDVVLLAGKGHETYQIVGGTRRPFDEAAIVRDRVGGGARGE